MRKVFEDFLGITALREQIKTMDVERKNLLEKVKYQQDMLYQVDKDKLKLAEEKIELQRSIKELENKYLVDMGKMGERIKELNEHIDSLKTALAQQGDIDTPTPFFLDQTRFCYKPVIQVEGETYVLQDPRDIYMKSDLLSRKLNINQLRRLPFYAKLMKVWEFVIQAIEYRFDKFDNWQPHTITIIGKKGDCEDGTILFLDACRIAGIPPDKVFNVVGSTSFGYHSYPIVWLEKEDLVGTKLQTPGFYIFETTLDFLPPEPKPLNGSRYWCEGGIQNWKFYGGIKDAYANLFNGIYPPTKALTEYDRIENEEEKRKRIKEYWLQG